MIERQVSITFIGADWPEVASQMRAALGASPVFDKNDSGPAKEPDLPKTATKPKPAATKEEPKEDPKAAASSDTAAEIDYDGVIMPSMLKLAEKCKRDGVMEVLSKYNVTNAKYVEAPDRLHLLKDIAARLAKDGVDLLAEEPAVAAKLADLNLSLTD